MIRDNFDFHSYWELVEPGDGCWIWKGSILPSGYGRFYDSDSSTKPLAHRISYEIHYGSLSDDFVVHHKCNNKACVNPMHLEACSREDNIRYAAIDGLMGKSTVLKLPEIETLINIGWSQKEIAKKYGVSRQALYSLVRGRRLRCQGSDISRPGDDIQYINCTKAANELGVTKQCVNIMVWHGKFKGAVRRLGRWYIPMESVLEIKGRRLNLTAGN